jgi:uncharacterized membrane protein
MNYLLLAKSARANQALYLQASAFTHPASAIITFAYNADMTTRIIRIFI